MKEVRAQQAATAEILKVINASPGDLTPVFETILEKTHHLCDVASGSLQLYEDGHVRSVATRGFNERWKQYLRQGYTIDDTNREALEAVLPRHVADMRKTLDRSSNATMRAFVEIGGFRTFLGLPLLKDGKAIGRIVAAREEIRPFTNRQIALLQGFADQAVIAIENARLFNEVQARTHDLSESLQQQTATADVLKVISRSTFDLQTVLETLIRSAVDLCGANRGSIFLREGDVFPLKAASHTTPEFLQYWAANPPRAGRGSATHRVIASGKVETIPDVLEDPEMEMPPGALARIRATLGVPMLRDNKVEGVLVLTRPEPGLFSKSQIDLVQTFADQAVIAVENVRLFDETQARSKELAASLDHLRTAQDRLVQTEKLASLG